MEINRPTRIKQAENTDFVTFLGDRTALAMIGYWHDNVVCLSGIINVTN